MIVEGSIVGHKIFSRKPLRRFGYFNAKSACVPKGTAYSMLLIWITGMTLNAFNYSMNY